MTFSDLAAMVREAQIEDLPALLGRLVEAEAIARLRLSIAAVPASTNGYGAPEADENLAVTEAARQLGVSTRWLYREARRLPFAVKIGRRLLFSRRGLERWNRQQRLSA